MTIPVQPSSSSPLRLTSGFELIESWSRDADDLTKTAVYEVLFLVAERSVFKDCVVVDDPERPTEFFVLTRRNLAVKIQLHSLDTCAVVYIGPASDAPGLDRVSTNTTSPGKDTTAGT
jgi:uncharacterized protein DUF6235